MKYVLFSLSLLLVVASSGASAHSVPVPDELVGSWRTGRVSLLNYRNNTTGSTTPANGSTFSYRFYPDGRYEFTGFMQSTMYNCTTRLFNQVRGVFEVDGSQITLIQKSSKWQNENSCSPNSRTEKHGELKRDTFSWRIKTEAGKENFCITYPNGEENCFQREKD